MKRIFLYLFFIFTTIFSFPNVSLANTTFLTECDKSPAFAKRLNSSVKKLQNQLSKYDDNTPTASAIKEQIAQTNKRFDNYAKSNLMCGADGLPHLLVAQEILLPTVLFFYITGWIGWSGRKYLQTVATDKNSTEKEIIIDVPLALNIMLSGYFWPLSLWGEFTSGKFVSK